MDVLQIRREPGQAPQLRQPIPRLAVVTLGNLLSAVVREWVEVAADDLLRIAGHEFVPVAWVEVTPPGILVEHACCPESGGL